MKDIEKLLYEILREEERIEAPPEYLRVLCRRNAVERPKIVRRYFIAFIIAAVFLIIVPCVIFLS